MKLKYEKTPADKKREDSDMRHNPILRFLNNQEHFKFNIGDVLIKQRCDNAGGEWKTELTPGVNTPRKFMYAFENELGIGYVKQLRVDGSGFTTALVCTANFNPNLTRFQLDPDYVDHMLIGEEDFEYNKQYLSKKTFREEAIKKNTKLLVSVHSMAARVEWILSLKPGQVFWAGDTFDEMCKNKYEVVNVLNDYKPPKLDIKVLSHMHRAHLVGTHLRKDEAWFHRVKVSMQEPFLMEDPLCDRQR
jgi:hypothetical protein